MRKFISVLSLFMGALVLHLAVSAQSKKAPSNRAIDIALTYTAERAKISGIDCGCFWLQGGSVDGAFTFYHGLGAAANVTVMHADDISSGGGSVGKTNYLFGPRYTFASGHIRHARIFGQALFGGVHGFDGAFPSSSGVAASANSFAYELGGGADISLTRGFGLRLPEIDYVYSTLPNAANDAQHDLRVAAGISYRFSRK